MVPDRTVTALARRYLLTHQFVDVESEGAEHLSFIAAALAKRTTTTPDQHGEISSDDTATDRSLSNAVRTFGVLFTEIRSTSLP